jgi:hypothetical protein
MKPLCAVKWCVCLAKKKGQFCAVHATKGEKFHVGASESGVTVECDECDGTGDCPDCDGEGTHQCEHRNCYDEHECHSCEGTGDCAECSEGRDSKNDELSFEARYLSFAFDPGWVPPVLIDYPWDSAS